MCGRYTREYTWSQVHDFLDLKWPSELEMQPSYNVAPTQTSLVVRQGDQGRTGAMFKWGLLPSWAKPPGPINARAETVVTQPMFRSAFAKRRCVVPVSGFYEWQKPAEGTKAPKQPWYIHRADGAILLFAGLWEYRDDGETFTIITTAANEFMTPMHDRMPAVLEPESVTAWLMKPDPALLRPAADGVLAAHRVSTRVNSPKNNEPDLVQPLSP